MQSKASTQAKLISPLDDQTFPIWINSKADTWPALLFSSLRLQLFLAYVAFTFSLRVLVFAPCTSVIYPPFFSLLCPRAFLPLKPIYHVVIKYARPLYLKDGPFTIKTEGILSGTYHLTLHYLAMKNSWLRSEIIPLRKANS